MKYRKISFQIGVGLGIKKKIELEVLTPAKAILFLKVVEPFVKSKTLGNIPVLALNAKKTTNMMISFRYMLR